MPARASVDSPLLANCAHCHAFGGIICCVGAVISGVYGPVEASQGECVRAMAAQATQCAGAYGAEMTLGTCCCGAAFDERLVMARSDPEVDLGAAGDGQWRRDSGGAPSGRTVATPGS